MRYIVYHSFELFFPLYVFDDLYDVRNAGRVSMDLVRLIASCWIAYGIGGLRYGGMAPWPSMDRAILRPRLTASSFTFCTRSRSQRGQRTRPSAVARQSRPRCAHGAAAIRSQTSRTRSGPGSARGGNRRAVRRFAFTTKQKSMLCHALLAFNIHRPSKHPLRR
jgi:hypothetical protein